MSFSNIITRLLAAIEREPAAFAYGVTALIGPAAVLFHWPHTTTTIVLACVSAAATIYTAVKARPIEVPAVVGGVMAIATAIFGQHLPVQTAAELSSGLSIILALAFRANLTPVVSLRGSLSVR